MISLVGYTGFVGSNLAQEGKFTSFYNSKDIDNAFGTNPDLLVYSGVRAEKYLANQDPEQDYYAIKTAFDNIKKINPKRLVLISTIDVYKKPVGVNENTQVEIDNLQPYGLNRYYLEKWVEESFEDSLIIRLPGLYGKNIKKNFIYDLIYVIPQMLRENKYAELYDKNPSISEYYINLNNGFYKCRELSKSERIFLKECFNNMGFSALNFTDSRGSFQFYNLKYLWEHINIAINEKIHKLNIATEPVTIEELYRTVKNGEFINKIAVDIPNYNFKSIYADSFNGSDGYIFNKSFLLNDIKNFVEGYHI